MQGPASSGKLASYIANYALLYLTLASNDAGLAVDVVLEVVANEPLSS